MWWLYTEEYPDEFAVYEAEPFRDEDEDEDMIRIEKIIYQSSDGFDVDELVILSNYDYSRMTDDGREVITHLMSGGHE